MQYVFAFALLLIGYTFIYSGVSKFWHGVTASYIPTLAATTSATSSTG